MSSGASQVCAGTSRRAHAQDVEVDDVEEARASAPTTSQMHVASWLRSASRRLAEHDKDRKQNAQRTDAAANELGFRERLAVPATNVARVVEVEDEKGGAGVQRAGDLERVTQTQTVLHGDEGERSAVRCWSMRGKAAVHADKMTLSGPMMMTVAITLKEPNVWKSGRGTMVCAAPVISFCTTRRSGMTRIQPV